MNTSRCPHVLAIALLLSAVASLAAADESRRPASVITSVAPTYPYLMRHKGTTAEVTVLFTVNSKGIVTKASIADSTNFEFNAAALEAIRKWTFAPATRNGEAVAMKIRQTFTFTLGDPARANAASEQKAKTVETNLAAK